MTLTQELAQALRVARDNLEYACDETGAHCLNVFNQIDAALHRYDAEPPLADWLRRKLLANDDTNCEVGLGLGHASCLCCGHVGKPKAQLISNAEVYVCEGCWTLANVGAEPPTSRGSEGELKWKIARIPDPPFPNDLIVVTNAQGDHVEIVRGDQPVLWAYFAEIHAASCAGGKSANSSQSEEPRT